MLAPARQNTRGARITLTLIVAVATISIACRSAFSRKYEYDEDIYLAVDGSATVYVNASVPALAALRGFDLDVNPRARLDRTKVRALFESPVVDVASVTGSRRDNRRYVHVRLEVSDITRLHEAAPFSWSRYALERNDQTVRYRQVVGPSAGQQVGDVGWMGAELVAFRLHLPSRVSFHNSPSREIQRGNIIAWEQLLTDRIRGQPIEMEVAMDAETILIQTLTLFAITVVLAAATFGAAIWWVLRRGGQASRQVSR
jgi:hypothetical protein